MDPLSITASVIAVIQLSEKIVRVCKTYVRSVRGAPNDLRLISVEVGSLKCVLEILELLVSSDETGDHSALLEKLKGSDGPLQGCKHALSQLEQLIPTPTDRQQDIKRRKIVSSLTNLAWPLKETSARKLLDEIGRHKATITLFLTADTIPDIKEIKNNVKKIKNIISHDQRTKILEWLVTTDPSSNHTNACRLREPETGKWLLRSPEYQSWKLGSSRFLWLHGIPGAGKTVLASHIVEDVKALSKSSPAEQYGWSFYYCYFLREQNETTHLLRWLLNQLSRQCSHIPDILVEHYNDGVQPSFNSLVCALATLVLHFSRILVVIDALDESNNRSNILSLLTTIATDYGFANVNLLVLSRKEIDIERAIKPISTDISLSNPLVDEDICLYIQEELQDNTRFGRWPSALKIEVEATLISGSKGMFGWVSCQLDALKRLRPSRIRQALKELPQTLDETYERILQNIPVDQQNSAHRAFQFLAFDFDFDTLDELADAVVVNDEQCVFDKDDRFFDLEDLLEICTCLITYNKGAEPEIRLAHYTVKEYLLSARVRPTLFKISELMAKTTFAKCSIAYLLTANYDAAEDFPFLRCACNQWFYAARFLDDTGNHLAIRDVTLKLLNPLGAHFDGYVHYHNSDHPTSTITTIYLPTWSYLPEEVLAVTIGYLCHFGLLNLFKYAIDSCSDLQILESRLRHQGPHSIYRLHHQCGLILEIADLVIGCTLLQISLANLEIPFATYLIDKGVNINAVVGGGSNLLALVLENNGGTLKYNRTGPDSSIHQTLRLLLSAGMDPNPCGVAMTPLQAAVKGFEDIELVMKLLEAGSDVNAVGDDEAVIERLKHFRKNPIAEEPYMSLEEEIHRRGFSFYYATPLKIMEDRKYYSPSGTAEYEAWERVCAEIKDLLISYGGKSLHLFPVEDLPGYNADDIQRYYHCSEPTFEDAHYGDGCQEKRNHEEEHHEEENREKEHHEVLNQAFG